MYIMQLIDRRFFSKVIHIQHILQLTFGALMVLYNVSLQNFSNFELKMPEMVEA